MGNDLLSAIYNALKPCLTPIGILSPDVSGANSSFLFVNIATSSPAIAFMLDLGFSYAQDLLLDKSELAH